MSTFSSAQSVTAFDKSANQPLGALSTGMGYPADKDVADTTSANYIGGAAQTIGYGKGVQVNPPASKKK
jgi:hypothetical protein